MGGCKSVDMALRTVSYAGTWAWRFAGLAGLAGLARGREGNKPFCPASSMVLLLLQLP